MDKNHKSRLVFQINNLEALERLIGGDSQVEMDIRQSVVEAFAKKHLKSLVTDTAIEKVGSAIKNEATAMITEQVKDGSWSTKTVLTEKARQLIKDSLTYSVNSEIYEVIKKEVNEQATREKIASLLEKQAEWIVNDLTSSNLEARLDKMVDKKLKERLGLK